MHQSMWIPGSLHGQTQGILTLYNLSCQSLHSYLCICIRIPSIHLHQMMGISLFLMFELTLGLNTMVIIPLVGYQKGVSIPWVAHVRVGSPWGITLTCVLHWNRHLRHFYKSNIIYSQTESLVSKLDYGLSMMRPFRVCHKQLVSNSLKCCTVIIHNARYALTVILIDHTAKYKKYPLNNLHWSLYSSSSGSSPHGNSHRKSGHTCVLACKIWPLFKKLLGKKYPFSQWNQEIFNSLKQPLFSKSRKSQNLSKDPYF